MLKVRREPPKIPTPRFVFDQKLLDDASDILNASIIRNVIQQKTAKGSALKRNAASTLRAKRAAGHGTRSLVAAMHRFVNSGAWGLLRWGGAKAEFGALNAELARLVRLVAAKGYRGYIGPDRAALHALKAALVLWVRRELAKGGPQ